MAAIRRCNVLKNLAIKTLDMDETEYEVLYTHQKTKKAKTWHDGSLKHKEGGKQAILLDMKNSRLDSLYLRGKEISLGDELESEKYLIQVESVKARKGNVQASQKCNQDSAFKSFPSRPTQVLPSRTYVSSNIGLRMGLKRKRSGFVPPRQVKPKVETCSAAKSEMIGTNASPVRHVGLTEEMSLRSTKLNQFGNMYDTNSNPGYSSETNLPSPWSVVGTPSPSFLPETSPLSITLKEDIADSKDIGENAIANVNDGDSGINRTFRCTESGSETQKRSTSEILALINGKKKASATNDAKPHTANVPLLQANARDLTARNSVESNPVAVKMSAKPKSLVTREISEHDRNRVTGTLQVPPIAHTVVSIDEEPISHSKSIRRKTKEGTHYDSVPRDSDISSLANISETDSNSMKNVTTSVNNSTSVIEEKAIKNDSSFSNPANLNSSVNDSVSVIIEKAIKNDSLFSNPASNLTDSPFSNSCNKDEANESVSFDVNFSPLSNVVISEDEISNSCENKVNVDLHNDQASQSSSVFRHDETLECFGDICTPLQNGEGAKATSIADMECNFVAEPSQSRNNTQEEHSSQTKEKHDHSQEHSNNLEVPDNFFDDGFSQDRELDQEVNHSPHEEHKTLNNHERESATDSNRQIAYITTSNIAKVTNQATRVDVSNSFPEDDKRPTKSPYLLSTQQQTITEANKEVNFASHLDLQFSPESDMFKFESQDSTSLMFSSFLSKKVSPKMGRTKWAYPDQYENAKAEHLPPRQITDDDVTNESKSIKSVSDSIEKVVSANLSQSGEAKSLSTGSNTIDTFSQDTQELCSESYAKLSNEQSTSCHFKAYKESKDIVNDFEKHQNQSTSYDGTNTLRSNENETVTETQNKHKAYRLTDSTIASNSLPHLCGKEDRQMTPFNSSHNHAMTGFSQHVLSSDCKVQEVIQILDSGTLDTTRTNIIADTADEDPLHIPLHKRATRNVIASIPHPSELMCRSAVGRRESEEDVTQDLTLSINSKLSHYTLAGSKAGQTVKRIPGIQAVESDRACPNTPDLNPAQDEQSSLYHFDPNGIKTKSGYMSSSDLYQTAMYCAVSPTQQVPKEKTTWLGDTQSHAEVQAQRSPLVHYKGQAEGQRSLRKPIKTQPFEDCVGGTNNEIESSTKQEHFESQQNTPQSQKVPIWLQQSPEDVSFSFTPAPYSRSLPRQHQYDVQSAKFISSGLDYESQDSMQKSDLSNNDMNVNYKVQNQHKFGQQQKFENSSQKIHSNSRNDVDISNQPRFNNLRTLLNQIENQSHSKNQLHDDDCLNENNSTVDNTSPSKWNRFGSRNTSSILQLRRSHDSNVSTHCNEASVIPGVDHLVPVSPVNQGAVMVTSDDNSQASVTSVQDSGNYVDLFQGSEESSLPLGYETDALLVDRNSATSLKYDPDNCFNKYQVSTISQGLTIDPSPLQSKSSLVRLKTASEHNSQETGEPDAEINATSKKQPQRGPLKRGFKAPRMLGGCNMTANQAGFHTSSRAAINGSTSPKFLKLWFPTPKDIARSASVQRTAEISSEFSSAAAYRQAIRSVLTEFMCMHLHELAKNYHKGYEQAKHCNIKSIEAQIRRRGIDLYTNCLFLKKTPDYYQSFKDKFRGHSKENIMERDKKIYIRLSRKEMSSKYGKDDLWVVSNDLNFSRGNTFIAKSVFFGPTSNKQVEIEPIAAFSPSNWANECRCHAIHAGNWSSELVAMSTLQEFVQPGLPILPYLLSRNQKPLLLQPVSCTFKGSINNEVKEMIAQHNLNAHQSKALRHVANMFTRENVTQSSNVTLIHGVFGAGKSFLLAIIVQLLLKILELKDLHSDGVAEPSKLLISSNTNVAVDRVLQMLLQTGFDKFVRVGSIKKIAKPILPYSVHATGTDNQELRDLQDMLKSDISPAEKAHVRQSIDQLKRGVNKRRLEQVRVVGVTCAACPFKCLAEKQFSVVILDESSQITEPTSLVPIARFGCEKLILVGDPKQLDPTIQCPGGIPASGLEQTLFDRLSKMGHEPVMLSTQYRCHPKISAISNHLFYENKLTNGISEDDRPSLAPGWPALCFFDIVDGMEQQGAGRSYGNQAEACFVVLLIEALLIDGVCPADIGVITLYKAQQEKIATLLNTSSPDRLIVQNTSSCCCDITDQAEIKSIQISTVDAFQGGEKGIIILSCVRTQSTDFIDNDKRTNVALTRSRNHLLIVGNGPNLYRNYLWKQVIQHCQGAKDGIQNGQKFGMMLRKKMHNLDTRGNPNEHNLSPGIVEQGLPSRNDKFQAPKSNESTESVLIGKGRHENTKITRDTEIPSSDFEDSGTSVNDVKRKRTRRVLDSDCFDECGSSNISDDDEFPNYL